MNWFTNLVWRDEVEDYGTIEQVDITDRSKLLTFEGSVTFLSAHDLWTYLSTNDDYSIRASATNMQKLFTAD